MAGRTDSNPFHYKCVFLPEYNFQSHLLDFKQYSLFAKQGQYEVTLLHFIKKIKLNPCHFKQNQIRIRTFRIRNTEILHGDE